MITVSSGSPYPFLIYTERFTTACIITCNNNSLSLFTGDTLTVLPNTKLSSWLCYLSVKCWFSQKCAESHPIQKHRSVGNKILEGHPSNRSMVQHTFYQKPPTSSCRRYDKESSTQRASASRNTCIHKSVPSTCWRNVSSVWDPAQEGLTHDIKKCPINMVYHIKAQPPWKPPRSHVHLLTKLHMIYDELINIRPIDTVVTRLAAKWDPFSVYVKYVISVIRQLPPKTDWRTQKQTHWNKE